MALSAALFTVVNYNQPHPPYTVHSPTVTAHLHIALYALSIKQDKAQSIAHYFSTRREEKRRGETNIRQADLASTPHLPVARAVYCVHAVQIHAIQGHKRDNKLF